MSADSTLGCQEERDKAIEDLCFGDIADDERTRLELHLLTCDRCFRRAEELMRGVAALRSASAATATVARADVIGALGISGGIDEAFAGHAAYVAFAVLGYAALHSLSLLTELSYFIDRHAGLAQWLLPAVFAWMAAGTLVALWVTVMAARGDGRGALSGTASLVGFIAIMLLLEQLVLPRVPTISAAFTARTVASANLRNTAIYGLPLGLLYALIPFHFVTTLQRELSQGRYLAVARFFSRDPLAAPPRGALWIPPWTLGGLLIVVAMYLVVANQYLLDRLVAGPHSELFTALIYLRIALGLGFAATCVAWYSRQLDEVKREAFALNLVPSSTNDGQSRAGFSS